MPIRKDVSNPEILQMQGIHLYHFGMSNCAMRVRVALAEKGLDWESHWVDILHQKNLTEEYFEIHPKGLVPAMVHDGTVIYDSVDILRYLEEKFPDTPLMPEDPEERKAVNAWMDEASNSHVRTMKTWVYGTVGPGFSKGHEHMDKYKALQKDPELLEFHAKNLGGDRSAEVARAESELHEVFGRIESALTQHKWLVGDQYTYADIAWMPQYVGLSSLGFDFSAYPHVQAWVEEVKKRPSFQKGITDWLPFLKHTLFTTFIRVRSKLRKLRKAA